jgi:lipopolysaccharide export system permease protein
LAETNPRRASNWNLLFALLTFVVYYNVLNLTQAWVTGGKLGLGLALLLVHGGAFAIALGLVGWRERRNSRRKWHPAAVLARARR